MNLLKKVKQNKKKCSGGLNIITKFFYYLYSLYFYDWLVY